MVSIKGNMDIIKYRMRKRLIKKIVNNDLKNLKA